MKTLRIGIIDLASKGPTRAVWARMMNANLASLMPQAVAVWCRAGRTPGHVRLLYRGREPRGRASPGRGCRVHRCIHRGRPAGIRPEQPVPVPRRCHGHRRPPRPLLSRRCGEIFRLCARSHGPADHPGGAVRQEPPPSARAIPDGQRAAHQHPGRAGALGLHRGHPQEGSGLQDHPHARERGVPLHVQLLHRFDDPVPEPLGGRDQRGSPVPADEVPAPRRGMA